MSLTIFLAVAIIGCDVLIYFLYEWAFGQSERIRKRHARSSRLWPDSAEYRQGRISGSPDKPVAGAPVIEMKRRVGEAPALPAPVNLRESLAYRRLVASFAPAKPRT